MSYSINRINANPNFYSSMLGLNSTNQNSSNAVSNTFLSDYASIKNGSYGKLLKSYYAKQQAANKTQDSDEVKSEKRELSKAKSEAENLSKAASDLYSDKDLFEKKEITGKDSNGNTTTTMDYDRDEIKKKVNSFVKSYNEMVKMASDSYDTGVLRPALNSVKRTANNASLLSKVGISIEKGNTLKVDEKQLEKASINDLKALFDGKGSYAYWVGANASATSNYTSGKLSNSGLYSSQAINVPQVNASTIENYL